MQSQPILGDFHVLLSGAAIFGSWVAGLFFWKFWQRSRDNLFRHFALAFWLLGLERGAIILFDLPNETRTMVMLIRLAAFTLIFWAILEKNREKA